MRRLGKGFALPLAPNPVRRAAALPTPTEEFRRVSEANLEVERFGLPNKPTGTPEQLEKLVRCGDWGEFHSPLAPS